MSQPTTPGPCEILPRVVRVGALVEVTIAPGPGRPALRGDVTYEVIIQPMEEVGGFDAGQPDVRTVPCRADGGVLRLRGRFTGEQEYLFHVDALLPDGKAPVGDARLYALADDLFARRPFKGDLHMHSNCSDGRESPAAVAAACRRIGLDFMALTDHWRYTPSLAAQAAFAKVPVDLRIYPGEEVHFHPHNPVHIVNFGGRCSVNALITGAEPAPGQDWATRAAQPAYLAEVEALAASLPPGGLSPARRFQYAQCLWTYRRIREAGGLSIFCHPYWLECRWYNVPECLIARHFAERPFDAYEVIGGYARPEVESNLLQVARYHEERLRNPHLPIVSVSDAHGCGPDGWFGWYYTIVFAPSAELPDLIEGIRGCQAVAVEALPGEAPRAHGPFRLAKYAQFLLRAVFPAHDALCAEEGQRMAEYLEGKPGAVPALAACAGRVQALYDRYWGATRDS